MAIVFFNPDMLGEKKYSPPFGVMKTPKLVGFCGWRGSIPIMVLVP